MRFTLVLLAALAVQVAAAHLMGAGQIPGPSWWERNLAFVEKEPLPALAEHFGVDGAATLWFAAWTDVTRRLGGRFRLKRAGTRLIFRL